MNIEIHGGNGRLRLKQEQPLSCIIPIVPTNMVVNY